MTKRPVGITETILRDAHQSLLATRMCTDDMLGMAEDLDAAGFYSLEAWGGATFDASLRFLNECPWERLNRLRFRIRNTPLQMLLRGQNLLGYKHYPDDVVDAFVKYSIKNGIRVLRIFDALNDVRNMQTAIQATIKYGGHAQGAICYTSSPVHNIEHFLDIARQLMAQGVHSICVKDMAGLLAPYTAYELITKLKAEVNVPVVLHTHYTSGMGSMTYLKAIEAGVDAVDTALSPLALGSSQPPTEPLVATLQGTPYDTGISMERLIKLGNYFREIKANYNDVLAPQQVVPEILSFQIPGGMLSNLRSQLKAQGMSERLHEVFEEVPRVRADMGYPPLVTPMSQIVGTQAVLNVIAGERYAICSKEIKDYVRGLYGKPPAEIDPDIRTKVIGDEEVFTGRPADLLEPMLEQARAEIREQANKEEDVLSYVLFPQVALEFFAKRAALTK